MKVKLNYQWLPLETMPLIADFNNLREGLEHILEHHGALIDRRARLIKQPVIYADINDLQGVNAVLGVYGLKAEPQGEYRV